MSTILFKACRKRTEHREYVPFSMRLSEDEPEDLISIAPSRLE